MVRARRAGSGFLSTILRCLVSGSGRGYWWPAEQRPRPARSANLRASACPRSLSCSTIPCAWRTSAAGEASCPLHCTCPVHVLLIRASIWLLTYFWLPTPLISGRATLRNYFSRVVDLLEAVFPAPIILRGRNFVLLCTWCISFLTYEGFFRVILFFYHRVGDIRSQFCILSISY